VQYGTATSNCYAAMRVRNVLGHLFDLHLINDVMAENSAILSGSCACKVVSGKQFNPGNADFIMPYVTFFPFIPRIIEQGFHFVSAFAYNSKAAMSHPARGSVDVSVAAQGLSPVDVVLLYHSTCVMNFITHNSAVILYPELTFAGLNVENDVRQEGMHPDIVAKYVNRGFNTLRVGDVHPKMSYFQGWSSRAHNTSKWDESMVFPISWHESPVIDVTSS
jgi:hypothetical protein